MSPSAVPRLQAVLFDMGKTLWHPAPHSHRARNRQAHAALYAALAQYYPAISLPDNATFDQVLQSIEHQYGPAASSNAEILEYLATTLGWGLDPTDARLLDAWHAPKTAQLQLEPDLAQTLATLQALGLRLGVISNTRWPARWHDRELVHYGLLAYFPIRIYSADLRIRKPDPRIFTAALTALGGVPAEQVLFVGDKLDVDVVGAHQAGWRTAWLVPAGKSEAPAPGAIQPDIVLTALRDLPAELQAHYHLPSASVQTANPGAWVSC